MAWRRPPPPATGPHREGVRELQEGALGGKEVGHWAVAVHGAPKALPTAVVGLPQEELPKSTGTPGKFVRRRGPHVLGIGGIVAIRGAEPAFRARPARDGPQGPSGGDQSNLVVVNFNFLLQNRRWKFTGPGP